MQGSSAQRSALVDITRDLLETYFPPKRLFRSLYRGFSACFSYFFCSFLSMEFTRLGALWYPLPMSHTCYCE